MKKMILIAIFFTLSCQRVYKLSEEDLKWVPYNGDETLQYLWGVPNNLR